MIFRRGQFERPYRDVAAQAVAACDLPIELCEELRSIGVTAPVLFYTGKSITNELLENAMRAGAQGFLTKPVDANAILQRVSDFIGQPKLSQ